MEVGEKKSLFRKYFRRKPARDPALGESGNRSFLSQPETSGRKSLGETRREFDSRSSLRGYQPGSSALGSEASSPLRPVTAGGLPRSQGSDNSLFDRLQASHTKARIRRHTDAASFKKYVELDYDNTSRSGTSHRKRFSEDVADRNLNRVRPDGHLPAIGHSIDILDHNLSGYPRVVVEKGRYSETVADRNMSMSTTSVLSHASSNLSPIKIWGDQLAALQLSDEPQLSFDDFDHNGKQQRPSMYERMITPQGTTVMFVPPVQTDALSDSYYAESDLNYASSAEETPRYGHSRMPSLDAAPYRGHSRMSSLDVAPHSSTHAHRRMSSLDKSLHDHLYPKAASVKSASSGVSSSKLIDESSSGSDAIFVQPLNVAKSASVPPPIPRRATQHRIPDHLAAIGTAITKDDSHSNSGSSSSEAEYHSSVGSRSELEYASTVHARTSDVAARSADDASSDHESLSSYAAARASYDDRIIADQSIPSHGGRTILDHVSGQHDYGQEVNTEPAKDGNDGSNGYRHNGQLGDSNAKAALAAAGFNLNNTAETHIYEKIAPAVTKEVIIPTIREIRQKHITREIHHHDVFHRILPIRQTEILPARHWMQLSDGTRRAIPASAAPVGSTSRLILETRTDPDAPALAPRKFTACNLASLPQDFKNRVDADGVIRSHTTWIHPPVLQTGGYLSGQTVPFEFEMGSELSLIHI